MNELRLILVGIIAIILCLLWAVVVSDPVPYEGYPPPVVRPFVG